MLQYIMKTPSFKEKLKFTIKLLYKKFKKKLEVSQKATYNISYEFRSPHEYTEEDENISDLFRKKELESKC